MPRPAARLSNCYVPLPQQKVTSLRSSSAPTDPHPSENERPKRSDDRQPFELRQLCLETSVLTDALGSSLLELGHTKVICRVTIGTAETVDEGTLDCKVQLAPHVGVNPITQRTQLATPPLDTTANNANNNNKMFHSGRLHSQVVSREFYISTQLHSALQASIRLELFPKCSICVRVTILQDDGSALSACITAATLALVDAKIPMYDLVTSCTVAVKLPDDEKKKNDDDNEEVEATFFADPTEREMMSADAFICLALTANHKEISLWMQSGTLSSAMANEAVELGRNGCRTMHKFMRELWVSKSGGAP
jgi:ribonuclease PH